MGTRERPDYAIRQRVFNPRPGVQVVITAIRNGSEHEYEAEISQVDGGVVLIYRDTGEQAIADAVTLVDTLP